ncbi:MAG: hypothetical protein ABFD81_08975, partial [Syntrophaceae bacterium]
QPKPGAKTPRVLMLELTGIDIASCPRCGSGVMHTVAEIQPRLLRMAASRPSCPIGLNSS